MHVRIATFVACLVVATAPARAQTLADTTTRSPVAAGLASAMFPGLGSWYAGDDRHAVVHGALAVALVVTGRTMGNARGCDSPCGGQRDTPVYLVFLGYVTNQVWATITAVDDARAHNDRAERLRTGRIEVAPTLRLAAPPGAPEQWRVELRLLRMRL